MTTNTAQKIHLMIDLETTGTKPGCGILQLGIVTFDASGLLAKRSFNIMQGSNIYYGLFPDQATMDWWNEQDHETYARVFSGTLDLRHALKELISIYENVHVNTPVWCCGTDFDIPILEAAFIATGLKAPWHYGAKRDYRTVREHLFVEAMKIKDIKRAGAKHEALNDAIYQAEYLIEVNKLMREATNGQFGIL